MVSLTMMARLLEAVRPDARLLLVGDPDQLTVRRRRRGAGRPRRPPGHRRAPTRRSDASCVGADLAAADDPAEAALSATEHDRLRNGVVRLSRGRRFGGAIAALAVAVREGDAERVLSCCEPAVRRCRSSRTATWRAVQSDVVAAAAAVTRAARDGDVEQALARLEDHRLLCAHRHGPHGVAHWDRRASTWVAAALGESLDPAVWYPGQPLLVTRNDHDAKVYNGDTGVVVDRGGLVAAFAPRQHTGAAAPEPARRRADRLRDDDPPQPGQPVRHRARSSCRRRPRRC